MSMFIANLLFAFLWAAMRGDFTLNNLFLGFVIGYAILYLAQRVTRPSRYFIKVWQVITFIGFYLWELVMANLRVAYDVMTPGYRMRPGVIAIPLDARTDIEITLLANLITLTPGTLSLDVSTDRQVLYIHALYVDDVENVRRSIKDGLERRVLEVLR